VPSPLFHLKHPQPHPPSHHLTLVKVNQADLLKFLILPNVPVVIDTTADMTIAISAISTIGQGGVHYRGGAGPVGEDVVAVVHGLGPAKLAG
jgi:hypothetical protein